MTDWKFMAFDRNELKPGSRRQVVFKESFEDAESITGVSEMEIVKWLDGNSSTNRFIFSQIFENVSGLVTRTGVTKPFISAGVKQSKPGDIDWLAFPSWDITKSVAIEVKFFKSFVNENQEVNSNRLIKSLKESESVNSYLRFGFHKVYICLGLLSDARKSSKMNMFYRNATDLAAHFIFEHFEFPRIDPRIGLILLVVTQMTDKSFRSAAKIDIRIRREAIPFDQPSITTDQIGTLL